MKQVRYGRSLIIMLLLFVAIFLATQLISTPVAASSSIQPIRLSDEPLSVEQQQVQSIVLNDKQVLEYTTTDRSEVFAISAMDRQFPPEFSQCADGSCYQIDIFNFDQNATVIAIVHLQKNRVLEVLHIPGSHPPVNTRLYQRAAEIIQQSEDAVATIGFRPETNQIRLMDLNHMDTKCDGSRLCAGAVFFVDSGTVWVLVDLHTEEVAKIWWTGRSIEPTQSVYNRELTPEDCNTTKSINRDGWTMDYRTTANDSVNITSVQYQGSDVATSIKLLEWHAQYLNFGFVDYTGCGGGSSGFPISPFGDTQILDLFEGPDLVGFEVVQDFRMSNWATSDCNYRYEQHFQFYTDGRWRVATAAFGRGCGDNMNEEATYRPVVRIDIAANGDTNDTLSVWDGGSWVDQASEDWWLQSAPYTAEGYRYRVMDQSGSGYYIEPGQGQFGDGGTGDNAYFYLSQYKLAEGGTDTPSIGSCCTGTHVQGPEAFLNGEDVSDQNIVLWYVPQSETITTWQVNNGQGAAQYCWTDNTSNFWPCLSGPMFVPVSSCAGETAVAPNPTITPSGNNVDLSWDTAPTNSTYQVWRSKFPYFTPGAFQLGVIKIYDGTGTSFSDAGVLGDPSINYNYIIRSQTCDSTSHADSPTMGEFDMALLPGTP